MEKIRNEASRKMKTPLNPSLSSQLKTLQWLPVSLGVKAKVSPRSNTIWPSSSPLSPLWLHLLLSSLPDHSSPATLASSVSLEHAEPVLASGPLPFPLSRPIFPDIYVRLSHLLPLGPFKVHLMSKAFPDYSIYSYNPPPILTSTPSVPSKFTWWVWPSLLTPSTATTLPPSPALPISTSCFFPP